MRPLFIKKNGVVTKVNTNISVPTNYPASSVTYNNTTSQLIATNVQSAIDEVVNKVDELPAAYHHAGTKTCAELVSDLLVAANEGNVYNITDSGQTTENFIEGAGKTINVGDNVGIAKVSDGVYKFDLLAGLVDLSNYVQKSSTAGLIKNDGSIDQNTYQIAQEGKGLSTNDFTNEDKALIGQTLGNNTVLTTDKTPFLTRQTLNPTGFSGYVREKLIGASYAWNQLVQNGNFASISGWGMADSNGGISVSGNVLTYTVISANNSTAFEGNVLGTIQNHKYLVRCKFKANNTLPYGNIFVGSGGYSGGTFSISQLNTWVDCASIFVRGTGGNDKIRIYPRTGSCNVGDTFNIKDVQIIDLTLAFGSTIADYLYGLSNNGGITKLRDMGFPIDKYTPYGYGLYSVKTSGKKIVGKNLCEEKWRQGDWNETTAPSRVSIQNDSRVFLRKDVTYYIYNSGYSTIYWSAALIYHKDDSAFFTTIPWKSTETFTYTPSQDCYLAIVFKKANEGNITPQDVYDNVNFMVCHNSITDKSYEPYSSTTYPLGNDELRGKFDLVNGEIVASGDVKDSNGNINRVMDEVDLGSLEWITANYGFYVAFNSGKPPANNDTLASIVGTKYAVATFNNVATQTVDKAIALGKDSGGNPYLIARDTSYSASADFKTAVTGIKMAYLKSTPTTEQSTPFADPMSLVGATTEEYIDTRDIPCPVGAERQYMGQSEDVIEIPSSPQSDGVRYLKSYKSGNQEQLVWEGEGIEDISSYFTASTGTTDFTVSAKKYGHIIMFNISGKNQYQDEEFAKVRYYIPTGLSANEAYNVNSQLSSGNHIDSCIVNVADNYNAIYAYGAHDASDTIYISGIYITDK